MKNQLSGEIAMEYKRMSDALTNTYCQVRQHNPYDTFTKLTKNIWKTQMLYEIWSIICNHLDDEYLYEGGDDYEN